MKKKYKIASFILAIVFSFNFSICKPYTVKAIAAATSVLNMSTAATATGVTFNNTSSAMSFGTYAVDFFRNAGYAIDDWFTPEVGSDAIVRMNIVQQGWQLIKSLVQELFGSSAGSTVSFSSRPYLNSCIIPKTPFVYLPYYSSDGVLFPMSYQDTSFPFNDNGTISTITAKVIDAYTPIYFNVQDYIPGYYNNGASAAEVSVVFASSDGLITIANFLCASGLSSYLYIENGYLFLHYEVYNYYGEVRTYTVQFTSYPIFSSVEEPTVTLDNNVSNVDADIVDDSGKRLLVIPPTVDDLIGKTASDIVANPAIPQPTTGPVAPPIVPPWTGESSWPSWLTGAGSVISGIFTNIGSIAKTVADVLNPPKEADMDIQMPKLRLSEVVSTKFPFSIPWDLYSAFSVLSASPQAPVFSIPWTVGSQTYTWEINMSMFDILAQIVRWGLLIVFNFFLINATRRLIGAGS